MGSIEQKLRVVLARRVAGFGSLGTVSRLSGGASQETYRIECVVDGVEKVFAMRRAVDGEVTKPALGMPGLAVEAELMRAAKLAGVREPEIVHVLKPEDGLGPGFIMEWIAGESLGARIVKSPDLAEIRPRLARECGRVLARIHSIDVEAAGLAESLEVVPTEAFVQRVWQTYQDCETPQPMIDYTARWLLDHLPPEGEHRLVHNDFRNGNLIVTPEGIAAVLDWELAHIGDPVRDLGWICTNSWRFGRSDLPVGGFGRIEDLLDGYTEESGVRVDTEHLHFWIVFGSFWWAANCLKMVDHWRHGPDRSVERPAVSRRSSECQADCVNLLIPGPVELVKAASPMSSSDAPRVDELTASVRDFLRKDARGELEGRNKFLALVASNSLDIVLRELTLGPAHLSGEHARLKTFFREDGALLDLRWQLVHGLRDGSISLDAPGLAAHLRTTVMNQLAIDQPKYSALQTALGTTGRQVAKE